MSLENQINYEFKTNNSELTTAASDLANTIDGLLSSKNPDNKGYKSAFIANGNTNTIYRIGDALESIPFDDNGYYQITGIEFDSSGKPLKGIRAFKLPKKASSLSENDIKNLSNINIADITIALNEGHVVDGEEVYIKAMNHFIKEREKLIRNNREHSNDLQ